MQKTHCHGQTRLVRMVATGPGPQPHSGSSGQLNLRRVWRLAGLGQSVRSIIGHSAIERAPIALDHTREGVRVADQVDDDIFARPLADLVEFGDGLHLVQGDGGVHPAGEDQAVRVEFLEELRRL